MLRPRILLYFLAAILGIPSPLSAQGQADTAKAFVENLVEKARRIAAADLTPAQSRVEFGRLVSDGFAVDGIARFVLGAHWRSIDERERAEYLTLFEEILVNTATRRFRETLDWRLEVLAVIALSVPDSDEQSTMVQTRLWTSKTPASRIDWRVTSRRDLRRITDVQVEGISLAQTYRDEFTSIARRRGMVGLLTEMRRLRDELDVRRQVGQAGPTGRLPATSRPVLGLKNTGRAA